LIEYFLDQVDRGRELAIAGVVLSHKIVNNRVRNILIQSI
jgi:hypothetical protein